MCFVYAQFNFTLLPQNSFGKMAKCWFRWKDINQISRWKCSVCCLLFCIPILYIFEVILIVYYTTKYNCILQFHMFFFSEKYIFFALCIKKFIFRIPLCYVFSGAIIFYYISWFWWYMACTSCSSRSTNNNNNDGVENGIQEREKDEFMVSVFFI